MNPFQLSPSKSMQPADVCETSIRTMRLIEDLAVVAAELDASQWASVAIVQSPDRLQVSTYGAGEVTPLLAAALLAALEQMIMAGEVVRAKLSPEWRELLGT